MKTEELRYCLYAHRFPNGKIYFGITSQNPKYRWKNGNGYSQSSRMKNALAKYGWDNVEHLILATRMDKKKAEFQEIRMIRLFNTNNDKFGYNDCLGGFF